MFTQKTGLLLDPYFSGTKITWLLDHVKGARERAESGELPAGTVDSFLIWRLTGGKVHVDRRDQCLAHAAVQHRDNRWDAELLKILRIPAAMLPEVKDCAADFGATDLAVRRGDPDPRRRRRPAGGDHRPGLLPARHDEIHLRHRLLCAAQHRHRRALEEPAADDHRLSADGKTTYALEGSIFVAGAAVQWLRDGLKMIGKAAHSAILPRRPTRPDVYLVPAFVGLGAPHWDAEARGAIFGLTRNTGPAEFARAALEAVGYQTRDLLDAMRKDWKSAAATPCCASMAAWSPRTRPCSSWPIFSTRRSIGRRSSKPRRWARPGWRARGRASGRRPGSPNWALERRFKPAMDAATRKRKLKGWRDAVRRTLSTN